ncbi:MAG: hypothetical protein CMH65_00235 [Nevskiales bacterium]|nr:hypothetical protein [Nevskiales bacterium]
MQKRGRDVNATPWIKKLKTSRSLLNPQFISNRVTERYRELTLEICTGCTLDIGCGDMFAANSERISFYVGIDDIRSGDTLYGTRPVTYCDAHSLCFHEETFDTVVMLNVTEHLRDPEQAFEEAARVLKYGGLLVLFTPFIYPTHDAPYDYYRPTSFGIELMARRAGLTVESSYSAGSGLLTSFQMLLLTAASSVLEHGCKPTLMERMTALVVLSLTPLLNLVSLHLKPISPMAENEFCSLGHLLICRK